MTTNDNCTGIIIENNFSSQLLRHVVSSLSDVQKGYIVKYELGSLLRINSFDVPLGLVQWLIRHTHVPSMEFRHKNKVIKFTAPMVKSMLNP